MSSQVMKEKYSQLK